MRSSINRRRRPSGVGDLAERVVVLVHVSRAASGRREGGVGVNLQGRRASW